MSQIDQHRRRVARPAFSATGLSRRHFLVATVLGSAATVAAACTSAPQAPTSGPTAAQPAPAAASPAPAASAVASTLAAAPSPAVSPAASPSPTVNAAVPVAGGINKPRPDAYFRLGPPVAETKFENMGKSGFTTPNGLFFVRNHTTSMVVDPKTWQLSVEGSGVGKPFTLTYDDLLKLPSTTVTRYVECAGNGRSFYQTFLNHPAQGGQWLLGGYGIAEWTGVRMSELLDRAGVKSSATEVMPVGLDQQQVRRPMPLVKAQQDDTLLVYGMNGDVLPIDHGFPARMLVPGWVGVNNVKWVGKIMVTEQHNSVEWNTNLYVLIGPDYEAQGEAKGPPVSDQVIKSAVALPWPATLKAGSQQITGYAWSPAGKVSKVEVSIDGGNTFEPAMLVEPNTERAGVRWQITLPLGPQVTSIMPRATDETGKSQPPISEQKWNEQGYLFGASVPHPVAVTA